jgi:hypothetical protein
VLRVCDTLREISFNALEQIDTFQIQSSCE